VTVRRVLLDGLARDADIFELVGALAPLHPRDSTFPGEDQQSLSFAHRLSAELGAETAMPLSFRAGGCGALMAPVSETSAGRKSCFGVAGAAAASAGFGLAAGAG